MTPASPWTASPTATRAAWTTPDFTGLHRIEYGLYHGQSAATLLPIATQLQSDVTTIRKNLSHNEEAGDPTTLTLRVHEVLEDALRDHLSGLDDQGSGMAYAETYADSEVTRTLVGFVQPLLDNQKPGYVDTVNAQLDRLQRALLATQVAKKWQPADAVPLAARQRVDAAIDAVLESLSAEPALLLVPPNHCVRDPTSLPHDGVTSATGSSMPTTAPTTAPTTSPSSAPAGAPSQIPFCNP